MGWVGALTRFLVGGMLLGFSTANIITADKTIEVIIIDRKKAHRWPRGLCILFNRIERSGNVADLTTPENRQTFDALGNVILEGCQATKINWRVLSRN